MFSVKFRIRGRNFLISREIEYDEEEPFIAYEFEFYFTEEIYIEHQGFTMKQRGKRRMTIYACNRHLISKVGRMIYRLAPYNLYTGKFFRIKRIIWYKKKSQKKKW